MASTLSKTSLILSLVVVSSYQLCEWSAMTCIDSRACVGVIRGMNQLELRILRVEMSNPTSSPILEFTMPGLMSSGVKAMYYSMVSIEMGSKRMIIIIIIKYKLSLELRSNVKKVRPWNRAHGLGEYILDYAYKFLKPLVDDINITESERYPLDEYLHPYELSQRYQVDRNDVQYIDPYEKPEPIITEANASLDQNDQVDQTDQMDQDDPNDQNDHHVQAAKILNDDQPEH
ncbi:hypothetical protein Tco_1569913 [Tanacetum coccineum]